MDKSQVLLQDIRRMDAEALAKVFDLYASAIYKYAFSHCGNAITADQIVGDVFAKFLEQLSLGNCPSSNLRSYLYEIAYHLIVDEIRYSHRITSMTMVEYILPSVNSTDTSVDEHMLLETTWRAIQCHLTDDQRHVIILRFLEGLSLKETALVMGIKAGNVKVIQNRAVAALRKTLGYLGLTREFEEQPASSQQTI